MLFDGRKHDSDHSWENETTQEKHKPQESSEHEERINEWNWSSDANADPTNENDNFFNLSFSVASIV
tara:strand:+ start:422 stop:622 length:201 start_codon:yes stop_codon:yes gene_type:complete